MTKAFYFNSQLKGQPQCRLSLSRAWLGQVGQRGGIWFGLYTTPTFPVPLNTHPESVISAKTIRDVTRKCTYFILDLLLRHLLAQVRILIFQFSLELGRAVPLHSLFESRCSTWLNCPASFLNGSFHPKITDYLTQGLGDNRTKWSWVLSGHSGPRVLSQIQTSCAGCGHPLPWPHAAPGPFAPLVLFLGALGQSPPRSLHSECAALPHLPQRKLPIPCSPAAPAT